MRHFGSLLLAAVFAPSIFLLTGTGLSAFNSALDDNKMYDPLGSLAALGALLLAGVLYAILVMARLSPLGPGLAGLGSWAISGWALFDIDAYQEFFSQFDIHMGGAFGQTGLGIMLGVPLVATLFSGRRWRKSELYATPTVPLMPDQTWLLPAPPMYQSTPLPEMPLPDIEPPSLRYPASAAFQASPVSSTPSSSGPSWRMPPYIPPISEPPISEPPTSEPPISEPPTSEPPISEPPTSETPVSARPVARLPELTPPPVSGPPVSEPAIPDLPAMESVAEKLASWSATPAPDSEPPAPIVMAGSQDAPPLPRRVASASPDGQEFTAPIASTPPPPNDDVTERLGTPGSAVPQAEPAATAGEDETALLRPEP